MIYLRQSTASQEIMLPEMLDSTDGNTQETGLTIANTDIKLWKTGATTLADKNSGGATHIANGRYYAVLDATDTNTIGPMVIYCHPTGALATQVECCVLDEAVYDVLFGTTAPSTLAAGALMGLADDAITSAKIAAGAITSSEAPALQYLTGDAYARLGAPAGASVSADVASIKVDTGTTIPGRLPAALVSGRIDASVGAMASNVLTAAATATDFGAEIADAVWDETLSGHSGVGSTGAALAAAGGSGDPWATALPGAYGAGTAGAILGTTIPAAIADTPTVAEFEARTLPSADYTIVSDIPVPPTASAISDAVWDEATSGHTSAGSTGLAITSAASTAKKNTALANFAFVMTDSTTHELATGLTVSCTRSIDGGAFGAGTLANITEVGFGVYNVDFGAGDLNGDVVVLRATATDCDDTIVTIVTAK